MAKRSSGRHGLGQYRQNLIDPQTGETFEEALVFRHAQDIEYIRSLGLKPLAIVALIIRQTRSATYWRKAHKVGQFLATHTEYFASEQPHEVLKRLQVLAGQHCRIEQIEARPLIDAISRCLESLLDPEQMPEVRLRLEAFTKVPMRVPESLSFDTMDEAEFRFFMGALFDWISQHIWPNMEPDKIEQMIDLSTGARHA